MKEWEARQRKIRKFSELEYSDNKEEKRNVIFKELSIDPMVSIEHIDKKCREAGFGEIGLRSKHSILQAKEAYLTSFKEHYSMKLSSYILQADGFNNF